jgi:general stress protein 26
MTDDYDHQRLVELMEDMPIAMFTTFNGGLLRTIPMARQEVTPSAELWFISARDTKHVNDILLDPRVLLSFSSRDAWVALNGRAEIVDDRARLEELWNTFAEAWLPGGPDSPEAVLIRVDVERGEYWDTPGGTVASVISFAKAKLTGETYDAEHGVTHH